MISSELDETDEPAEVTSLSSILLPRKHMNTKSFKKGPTTKQTEASKSINIP